MAARFAHQPAALRPGQLVLLVLPLFLLAGCGVAEGQRQQGWQPGRIVELHLPQLAALGPMGEGGRGGLMPRESKLREVVAHNKWNNGIVQLSGLRFGHTEGKEASASKISRAEDQSAADASAISNPATEEASPAAPAVPTPLHSRGGGGGGGGPRHLQDETCELATDFTLSNTGYSAVTGCYSVISATEPYIFVPVAFDGLIMRSTYLTSEYGDAWLTAEVLSITGDVWVLSLECLSNEAWELGSHPSNIAEWTCGLEVTNTVVSAEDFGATCGCASTEPSVGASGCGVSDSFSITSSVLEEYEGCYVAVANTIGEGTFFSQTGTVEDGVLSVFAATIDGVNAFWVVGTFATDTDDILFACVSEENALLSHPADTTFYCDPTGTNEGAFLLVSDDQFSVDCRCDTTTSSTSTSAGGITTTGEVTYSSPGARDNDDPTTPAPVVFEPVLESTTPMPAEADELAGSDEANGGSSPTAAGPAPWLAVVVVACWWGSREA